MSRSSLFGRDFSVKRRRGPQLRCCAVALLHCEVGSVNNVFLDPQTRSARGLNNWANDTCRACFPSTALTEAQGLMPRKRNGPQHAAAVGRGVGVWSDKKNFHQAQSACSKSTRGAGRPNSVDCRLYHRQPSSTLHKYIAATIRPAT